MKEKRRDTGFIPNREIPFTEIFSGLKKEIELLQGFYSRKEEFSETEPWSIFDFETALEQANEILTTLGGSLEILAVSLLMRTLNKGIHDLYILSALYKNFQICQQPQPVSWLNEKTIEKWFKLIIQNLLILLRNDYQERCDLRNDPRQMAERLVPVAKIMENESYLRQICQLKFPDKKSQDKYFDECKTW